MDKADLLLLAANEDQTVAELTAAHPQLRDPLAGLLGEQLTAAAAAPFGGATDRVRAIVDRIRLDPSRGLDRPLGRLAVEELRAVVAADPILAADAELTAEIDAVAVAIAGTGPTVREAAGLDLPVRANRALAAAVAAGHTFELADAVRLPDGVGRVLADLGAARGGVAGIDESALSEAVDRGDLTPEEARGAGDAVGVYRLLDGRTDLVAAVAERLDDVRSLPALDAVGWRGVVEAAAVPPPAGLTPEAYADALTARVDAAFPTAAVVRRLRAGDVTPRRFPGLGLEAVLADETVPEADRAVEADRRARLAVAFLEANPDAVDLDLRLSTPDRDALVFPAGTEDADRGRLVSLARSWQRAVRLTEGDVGTAEALVTAGYPSAFALARAPQARARQVVTEALAAAGRDAGADAADVMLDRAKRIALAAGAWSVAGLDALKGGFGKLAVSNLAPDIGDFLAEVPGYADIFGNQDFCDCGDCRSVLSPAAYFVDLMRFVDANVTARYFTGREAHPLRLRSRRPDLWDRLELSCDATTVEVPYLEVINEVLEDAVGRDAGFPPASADREVLRDQVYGLLRNRMDSFQQPFDQPFTELAAYVRPFDLTLSDLAEAGRAGFAERVRLELGLSPDLYRLVTTPNPNVGQLSRLYGVTVTAGAATPPVDVQLLLPRIGVTREEFGDLVAAQFVTADGAEPVTIAPGRRGPGSPQDDIELVSGLTPAVLDRLHRFVRLWRAVGRGVGELDLALGHLTWAGIGAGLDGQAANGVAILHRLTVTTGIDLEGLLPLFSPLPERPATTGGTSLLDRLFNQPAQAASGGRYPRPGTAFLHPALAVRGPAALDQNLNRLLGGLGVTDAELAHLIVGLAVPLGVRPDGATDAERSVDLNLANLTLLYRHARLARELGLDVPDLMALIALAPDLPLGFVSTLDDLEWLLSWQRWVSRSGRTVAELTDLVRPGVPAFLASTASVTGSTAGTTVTISIREPGTAAVTEEIVLGGHTDLDSLALDWSGQSQLTFGYRGDVQGTPLEAGDRLVVRTRSRVPGVELTVAADPAALLTPAAPVIARGHAVRAPGEATAVPEPIELAGRLVGQVRDAGALEFSDTIFTAAAPVTARMTSRAAVTGMAAGTTVTYRPVSDGLAGPSETITFAAAAGLAEVVADWNGQAASTVATRTTVGGRESPTGTRLTVRLRAGSGDAARIDLVADPSGLFAAAPPTSFGGVTVTGERSRALLSANAGRVAQVDSEGHYRLAAGADLDVPLAMAGLDPALEPVLRGLLARHHAEAVLLQALPGITGLPVETVETCVRLLGLDLSAAGLFAELSDPALPPTGIAAVIEALRRLAAWTSDPAATGTAADPVLPALAARPLLFGVTDLSRIDLTVLRRVHAYRTLLSPWRDGLTQPPDLFGALTRYSSPAGFAAADLPVVARVLDADETLVRSVHAALPVTGNPFEMLESMLVAVLACRRLGVGGSFLQLVQSTGVAQLRTAARTLRSALRAAFPEETTRATHEEPLRDELLSRSRDALVAYLLRSRTTFPFDEVSDLFHYFLLDVQLEGVVRTTRMAAAIASVQLYVERCLTNLEQSPPGAADAVRVAPDSVPAQQCRWRRSYRLWEANRRTFLFPEKLLEPGLRDDRTPLFRALEEELLSKPITEDSVREAYARYLRGFDELASLRIAGSYHERDDAARRDALHLVGATADDPPLYYYRRVDEAHYGLGSEDRATRWGPWERAELQVPTRTVSPIVSGGQLHLFWTRYITKPLSRVENGTSHFAGYSHRTHLELSRRKLDGTWSTPQPIALVAEPFAQPGDGVVIDPLVPRMANAVPLPWGQLVLYSNYQPLYDVVPHDQPKDDYSLRGFAWDRVYPAEADGIISMRGVNFQLWSRLDLYRRRTQARTNYDTVDPPGPLQNRGVPWIPPETIEGLISVILLLVALGAGLDEANRVLRDILINRKRDLLWSQREGDRRVLHAVRLGDREHMTFDGYAFTTLLLEREQLERYGQPLAVTGPPPEWVAPQWHPDVLASFTPLFRPNKVLSVPADFTLDVVNGALTDVVVQGSREAFLLGLRTVDGKPYTLRRLGTSVGEGLGRTLFTRGLDGLLSTTNQFATNEAPHGLDLVASQVADRTASNTLDFTGPMGGYLRELFFHVPYLLADHLNSLGEYEAAQRWYEKIFDPTSAEAISVPPGLPEAEAERRALDRVWRYREFRGLTFRTLQQQLEDKQAIDAYERDPFNPHAIARLRLTAYQKAVVMRYVDNLLDWGDALFAEAYATQNEECLREATMKYVLAQELLGPRPARLGPCDDAAQRRTFADVVPGGDDFLLEVESWVSTVLQGPAKQGGFVPGWAQKGVAAIRGQGQRGQPSARRFVQRALGRAPTDADRTDPPAALRDAVARLRNEDLILLTDHGAAPALSLPTAIAEPRRLDVAHDVVVSVLTTTGPLFCVPENPDLLASWDRVEDRLYKIRNSLDPDGVFRRLPPFAPPIDPALLARARRAGIELEDALTQTAGGLPPFRFTVLLEKAKAYASAVSSLGASLQTALANRDTEQLTLLRHRHEGDVLALNRRSRRDELRAAEAALEQVRRQRDAAQYRFDHFSKLIATGLSTSETAQVAASRTSAVLRGVDQLLRLAAGITHLVPELGSPFAFNYGGKQLGDSLEAFAQAITSSAALADIVADTSATAANFERRAEGWQHERELASHDLRVLDREVASAELRRDIAQGTLDLHERTIEQHREVDDFYRDKLTGLGLYTHLARSLTQLHRAAYGNALAVARLAEQAYRAELSGDDTVYIGGEWDSARSGLLAGERLSLSLARMERRYLERNDRRNEIVQQVSLAQVAPDALVALRETGTCEVDLDEFWFDLLYPGQYRRQLRGVRLSIPSVTGPYTNVSARLTLLGSRIRNEPRTGRSSLVDVPPTRTVAMVTSTGVDDSGTFQWSMGDERYNPFEGGGAVSRWRIELPFLLRPFQYRTVGDVVLGLSYVADHDDALRAALQDPVGPDGLLAAIAARPHVRVLSLAHEFPDVFARLVADPVGTEQSFTVTTAHLPLYLDGRRVTVRQAELVPVVDRGALGTLAFQLNGAVAAGFARPPAQRVVGSAYGGLPAVRVDAAFATGLRQKHTLKVTNAGSLANPVTPTALDRDKLHDLLVVLRYVSP
ncbi:neuraminidase-like domain-containing protein [Streptomyces sp. NPDC056704]|uniref:Tc toxin subunit A-related protein n=1 Tax=Streptomyces sp. NPDC056704 TaxID=3345917 RepID=UPI0036ACEAE8